MKKQTPLLFLLITVLFVGLTLGFFLGRNSLRGAVTVSMPPQMQTYPTSVETTAPALTETAPVVFPIDINQAQLREFQALPGIGEVLAQRILAYREENGPFRAAEELMNVEGIGEKRLEAILDYITIGE